MQSAGKRQDAGGTGAPSCRITERPRRDGAEARSFAERLRTWRRMTAEKARGWALLLAEGMPGTVPGLAAALAREIEAYALRLLRIRLRSRGMSPAQLTGGESVGPRHLPGVLEVASARPEARRETDHFRPGDVDGSAWGTLLRPDASRPYAPPKVTREVFERFCRWTGMDPGCLGGGEEHQAGLVFYLVVFAMLTGPGASPDLPCLRLFTRLRQCREQLTRQAEDFFRGDPSAFARARARPSTTVRRVNDPTLESARGGLSAD